VLKNISSFIKNHYLLLTIAIFILLCAFNISTTPLWRDEAFSALVATRSWNDIITVAIKDTQPPLHMMLLHLSYLVGGKSELLIRIWSVMGGVITIIFTVKLADKLFSPKKLGYFVAPLIAFNPVLYSYSLEGRSYALFTAMFVTAVYFAVEYNSRKTKSSFIMIILASTLGLYLHNLFTVCFGIIMLILIWGRIKAIKPKPFKVTGFIDLLLLALIVVLLYLPWLFSFLAQLQQVGADGFWRHFGYLWDFLGVLSMSFIGEFYVPERIDLILAVAALLVASGLLGVFSGWRSEFLTIRKKVPVLLLTTLLPLVLIFLESFKTPFLYIRYLIFIVPFLILLTVRTYDRRIILVKLLLILTLIMTFATQILVPSQKEDYPSLIAALHYNPATDVVLHENALPVFGFHYYAPQIPSYIYAKPIDIRSFEGKAALLDSDYWNGDLAQVQRIWVVNITENQDFYNKLTALGFSEKSEQQFNGGLYLALFVK